MSKSTQIMKRDDIWEVRAYAVATLVVNHILRPTAIHYPGRVTCSVTEIYETGANN